MHLTMNMPLTFFRLIVHIIIYATCIIYYHITPIARTIHCSIYVDCEILIYG